MIYLKLVGTITRPGPGVFALLLSTGNLYIISVLYPLSVLTAMIKLVSLPLPMKNFYIALPSAMIISAYLGLISGRPRLTYGRHLRLNSDPDSMSACVIPTVFRTVCILQVLSNSAARAHRDG
jgi:hypothetical protein